MTSLALFVACVAGGCSLAPGAPRLELRVHRAARLAVAVREAAACGADLPNPVTCTARPSELPSLQLLVSLVGGLE